MHKSPLFSFNSLAGVNFAIENKRAHKIDQYIVYFSDFDEENYWANFKNNSKNHNTKTAGGLYQNNENSRKLKRSRLRQLQ